MDRRTLLKATCAACGSAFLGCPSREARAAGEAHAAGADVELMGVLVDLYRCTGCLKCEEACAESNGLPVPDITDKTVFDQPRTTGESQWTVVNRFETANGPVYVKSQCMHCNQPACAAACLVSALHKKDTGPVPWDGSKCMGCRYCMVSCPFEVPKFEYHSAVPKIQKCTFCHERLERGQVPACVEGCPVEALTFGRRRDLIEIARTRIYANPERYERGIYGEHTVGGTSWMYIGPVPFEQLGFRMDLGDSPYPELTQDFLYAVPFVLALWPALLYGMSRVTKAREEEIGAGATTEDEG